jgi:2-haloacid dehalogenase
MPHKQPKPVLAIDVFGTLIDPFSMETHLRAYFGEKAREAAELWRAKQLEYSFRRALMKKYVPFDGCTGQALRFVAAQFGISLASEAEERLLSRYRHLPAYPDVPGALAELSSKGFEIVAFSNGTARAVRSALDHAGILPRFGKIVSADTIRTFKPDPAVYEHLVKDVQAPREALWVISSNSFDVIGAKACGLRTVWVQRDTKRVFDPWEFAADVIVHGLTELKDLLTSR